MISESYNTGGFFKFLNIRFVRKHLLDTDSTLTHEQMYDHSRTVNPFTIECRFETDTRTTMRVVHNMMMLISKMILCFQLFPSYERHFSP